MKIKYLIASILMIISFMGIAQATKPDISTTRLNKLSGEKEKHYSAKLKWDQRYNKRSYVYGRIPAKFLAENFDYLKGFRTVLDMGMGEGRNAVFLAQKGHQVTGMDISSVAIKKARRLAKDHGVKIKTIVGAMDKYKIADGSYDSIICFYFVNRELNQKIQNWLKPGGILIYEAHTTKQLMKSKAKNAKISYYLEPQELLKMFPKMTILKYEEPIHENDYRASIILQKKGTINE
jgi:2-polyprenyl-3-methyl-5-hydroxy-6-metoxy-1,4-benzoquinol methylase